MIKYDELLPSSVIKDKYGATLTFNEALASIFTLANGHSQDTAPRSDWVDLHPVPITEDWLKKLGFIPDIMPDTVDENGDLIGGNYWISRNEKLIIRFYNNMATAGSISCTAVHEIQKLHYILTGQELQIINAT